MAPTPDTVPGGYISSQDIEKHSNREDCWIVLHSKVYDVSSFLSEHPGGPGIILKFAGQDATAAYDQVHAPGLAEETLLPEQLVGNADPSEFLPPIPENRIPSEEALARPDDSRPPLHSLISVHDFEDVAKTAFAPKAFAFYSSAATDLWSHRANHQTWQKLLLRPRILRDVGVVSIRRNILGCPSSAPFFVSPAAMAKLAHSDGELAIARGCGEEDIIQTISNNASFSLASIMSSGRPNQAFFFQLYVNCERRKTEDLLRKAKSLGVKAVFVTVDAPVPGKREADERLAAGNLSSGMSGAVAVNDKKGGGLGRVMAKYIDSTLNWEDLGWIKRVSGGLPLVLKGVQTAADAKMALRYPVDAILLSNHGGRSLDTVQPAILTLLEIHAHCPEVMDKLELYIDGGITRGADILKAIALGATAVGIGRPYMYSLAYGQDGVEHLTQILKDELISSMKLAGITHLDQAHPGMVNTTRVERHLTGESHPWIKWRPRAKL